MLREIRRLDAPELDAFHEVVEQRTPFLRVASHRSRNVSSDWGVVERAAPFVHRMARSCVTIVIAGRGRFDESGAHREVVPGMVAISDQARRGTEAYAGRDSHVLTLDWDAGIVGASHAGAVTLEKLSRADLMRVATAAASLRGPKAARATAEIVRVLRASGLAFVPIAAGDLAIEVAPEEQRLSDAVSARLSRLDAHPAIEDVVGELGWGARRVHRRLAASAERYRLLWPHWRSLLHHFRLVSALRLCSAPGATTERVARLTGFRAPTALCHMFEEAGLPSPGTFARDARRDVLSGWIEHVSSDRAA